MLANVMYTVVNVKASSLLKPAGYLVKWAPGLKNDLPDGLKNIFFPIS